MNEFFCYKCFRHYSYQFIGKVHANRKTCCYCEENKKKEIRTYVPSDPKTNRAEGVSLKKLAQIKERSDDVMFDKELRDIEKEYFSYDF